MTDYDPHANPFEVSLGGLHKVGDLVRYRGSLRTYHGRIYRVEAVRESNRLDLIPFEGVAGRLYNARQQSCEAVSIEDL